MRDTQATVKLNNLLKVKFVFVESLLKESYVIVSEYIDRAKTGTNDNHPVFQQMLYDSKQRTFEVVLVYKLDRFARNRYDSAINTLTLRNNGVKVVSAT